MDACTPECSSNDVPVTKPLTASSRHFFKNEEKKPANDSELFVYAKIT